MEATRDLCKILEPFKDATTYLSASRYPALYVIGPVLDKIQKNLVEDESSPVMARVKRAVASDIQTRYQYNTIRELMKKAFLLDPWLKSLVHLSKEEQTSKIDV